MDDTTRCVECLRLIFNSSEESVISFISANIDLVEKHFGYVFLQDSPCVCMRMLEQVKHNGHIFRPEKVIEYIIDGKCSHVTKKCNSRFLRQAKTSFLIVACILEKLNVVKFLIENGATVNQKTLAMNLTPLHSAILSKNLELFNYILTLDVDVNATCIPCSNKVSSLMLAVLEGAEEMVQTLLNHKNINKQYLNAQNKTALCCAAEINSIGLVDMLIKAGLKATNITICKAVQTDNADLLQLVLSSRRYFIPQFQTYALHTAVRLSNKKMLKLLLQRGFHFNHATDRQPDQESLHLAVLRNDIDMVEILLNHQIKLDTQLDGFTALDWAVLMDYDNIVDAIKNEYRLRCIVPKETAHKNCVVKALFNRDGFNRTNVIRQLAAKGFDLNATSSDGLSLLHEAVSDYDSNSLQVLLELGADPDVQSTEHPIRTPLYDAVANGNIIAAKMLLDANASMEFEVKFEQSNLQEVQDEGQFIVPLNELPLERSLLCAAVCRNLVEMVWLLLSCGYNVQEEKKDSLQWMLEKTKSAEIRLWLSESLESPPDLLLCCRNFIRKQWKNELKLFIENQCLPNNLKDKLLLKDVLHKDLRTIQKFCRWKNIF